jgi:DNA repair protein RecN (Recombination protein N)
MLCQLTVRNLVLIEQLVIEFGPGFNVLTGETGAGKSMLVHALSLVLGGRVRPDMVRSGAEEAEVEALFDLPADSHIHSHIEAAGIPIGRELVVRRVVQGSAAGRAEARSRAYVNGRLCTASQLAEITSDLCDIASQHESVSLTDTATHLGYLDAFGKLQQDGDRLSVQVAALAGAERERKEAKAAERARTDREDSLRWQAREIDEVGPLPGEANEIEGEVARLRHADRLHGATQRAAEQLYEGQGSACDVLGRVRSELVHAASIDASLEPHARAVESARTELADVARALARYAEGVEARPERLAKLEERAFLLQKLIRKNGSTLEEVIARRTEIDAELDALRSTASRAGEVDAECERLAGQAADAARSLSAKRRQAASGLAAAIGNELAQLGMGRARVVVEITPATASANALQVDGAHLTKTGIDRVEFLIAPNRGEEPRPLRRIASGGELSRALLALKRVLADQGPAGTYVFDEVDAGVGGAVAEVIGRAIADIARHRQVICLTHLAQIAALADAHYVVDKTEARGRTQTSARRLASKERIDEIARMIGGIKVGDAARRAARELLAAKTAPSS